MDPLWRICWFWLLCLSLLPRSQASTPSHGADGKWFTDWLVLDHYLSADDQARFLSQFSTLKSGFPEEKDTCNLPGGTSCAWKRVRVRGDFFNVRTAVGKDFQGKSAFLFCQLIADRAGDVEFRMSARPYVNMWLNGRQLTRGRTFYDDQFKGKGTCVFEGNVQASTNGLLIQISELGLDRGFGLRALPPERAVFSGRVSGIHGTTAGEGVQIVAWQGGRELARIRTDNSGLYHLSLMPRGDAPCDISFTHKDIGCWRLGEILRPGERRELPITMKPAVSISGTLTMMDKSQSPHREVTVQALPDGGATASVTSDDKGHYRFINLKPGHYQLRCQTAAGFQYYQPPQEKTHPIPPAPSRLKVEEGATIGNVDLRFPAFKKGFWKRYDTFDGLPNNKTQGVVVAPSGDLWFQTSMGLGFFDGRNISTIPGTQGKPITALASAPDGAIWFGAYSGLYRLQNGVLDCFTMTNGLPANLITAICATRSGKIWIGTEYGLSAYDGSSFRTYTIEQGLVQDHVVAMGEAPNGAIWVGTGGGLSCFDGKRFVNFSSEEGLLDNEITALDCSQTAIRAATLDGLAIFNGIHFTPLLSCAEFDLPSIKAIYPSADGRLWLGTERGLSIFDRTNMVHIHPDEGLGGGNVAAIVGTPEGLMWFATYNGVACFDPGFVSYSTKDGLADNRVFDISHIFGDLWFGMEWGGVGRFDGKTFSTVIPNLYARKLHKAGDGTMWMGSNKGAWRFDSSTRAPETFLENRWVMAIDHDSQGAVWLGYGWSGGGMSLIQTNSQGGYSVKNWTRADGLGDNQVNGILCLPGGITWLATSEGLSRFDGRRFQTFTKNDGLPDNMIRTVRQGTNGLLWIGTDSGIGCYDGNTFFDAGARHGLPATRIWCIHQARDGLVWFGTDTRGAFVFDGQAFSSFDTRDGLADNSVTAISEDGRGDVWFGTARSGLTRYQRKASIPKARITQVKAGGRVLSALTGQLRLRVGEPVTFSFESMDWLTPAQKKQYRVRLRQCSGSTAEKPMEAMAVTGKTDFDWIPQRAGQYAFEVEAVNQHLVYSTPVKTTVSVFIPWYEKTSWRVAAAMALTAVLIASFLLITVYLSQRREAQRLKDLMLAQEQSARAALEEKNRQLESRASELKQHQLQLEEALASVKTLRGLVPICAGCKKIRDDNGFWEHLESFVEKHSEAQFSHGMCPDCIKKWYPNVKTDT